MKKMILMAAIMLSSVSAFAQNEVGQITLQPKVGINFANLTGDGTKGKVGFAGGLEAEYGIAENFGLTLGAIFSMEGSKLEKINGEAPNLNLNYINVPVMLQYYVVPGLAIKAGAQFGFNIHKKISFNGNKVDADDFLKDMEALGFIPAVGAKIQTFNFSIPVGASYEYKNVVLDARYMIGATKNIKHWDKNKSSVFQITLGYKFAL